MKLNLFALLLGTSAVVLTGCETPNGTPDRTATGALTGGALGMASGALIGGRHAGEGALSDRTHIASSPDTNSLVRNRAFAQVRSVSGQSIEGNDPAKCEQWWTANKAAFEASAPVQ